jgi:hypothetical protein
MGFLSRGLSNSTAQQTAFYLCPPLSLGLDQLLDYFLTSTRVHLPSRCVPTSPCHEFVHNPYGQAGGGGAVIEGEVTRLRTQLRTRANDTFYELEGLTIAMWSDLKWVSACSAGATPTITQSTVREMLSRFATLWTATIRSLVVRSLFFSPFVCSRHTPHATCHTPHATRHMET